MKVLVVSWRHKLQGVFTRRNNVWGLLGKIIIGKEITEKEEIETHYIPDRGRILVCAYSSFCRMLKRYGRLIIALRQTQQTEGLVWLRELNDWVPDEEEDAKEKREIAALGLVETVESPKEESKNDVKTNGAVSLGGDIAGGRSEGHKRVRVLKSIPTMATTAGFFDGISDT